MALSSGELSAINGSLLLMTATATAKTVRLLMDELPEVRKWKFIFNSPLREDITIVIPHPEVVSPKFEVSLQPFVARMKLNREIYLILVRGKCTKMSKEVLLKDNVLQGINKGCSIFLHLLKQLGASSDGNRKVAFFHRNTTERRKSEILKDLKLPLDSPNKRFLAVVATVSLGEVVLHY